ncbi:hypothetical protein MTO96_023803 [Rhipicephalus appendiculatus]
MRRGSAVPSAGLREAGAAQCGPRPSARRPRATSPPLCEPQWPPRAGSARHRHAAQEDRAPHETKPRAAATPRRSRCRPRRHDHAEAALREHDMSGEGKKSTLSFTANLTSRGDASRVSFGKWGRGCHTLCRT